MATSLPALSRTDARVRLVRARAPGRPQAAELRQPKRHLRARPADRARSSPHRHRYRVDRLRLRPALLGGRLPLRRPERPAFPARGGHRRRGDLERSSPSSPGFSRGFWGLFADPGRGGHRDGRLHRRRRLAGGGLLPGPPAGRGHGDLLRRHPRRRDPRDHPRRTARDLLRLADLDDGGGGAGTPARGARGPADRPEPTTPDPHRAAVLAPARAGRHRRVQGGVAAPARVGVRRSLRRGFSTAGSAPPRASTSPRSPPASGSDSPATWSWWSAPTAGRR